MNANSTYSIGRNHIICEDYALSYSSPDLSYAIVCDGCSASPDVDFGARAMAMSAKRIIRSGKYNICDEFGENTIDNAKKVFDIFPYLHPQALDSTLLASIVSTTKFGLELLCYLYGDGVLVYNSKKDGKIYTSHISITSGAPDYLSYSLDENRKAGYDSLESNSKIITTNFGQYNTYTMKPFEPYVYNRLVHEGDVISVISDGINSFRKADNTPIPWQELVQEFTGFKTFEGEFVLRRLSAFKRKCLKEGITHFDDISIASIVI